MMISNEKESILLYKIVRHVLLVFIINYHFMKIGPFSEDKVNLRD